MATKEGVRNMAYDVALKNLREADAALLAAVKTADQTKIRSAAILFGRADSHARAAKLREVTGSVLSDLDSTRVASTKK